MAYDSLQAFDNLIAAGTPENQARAHVKEFNNALSETATKTDLLMLEKDLKIFFTWEIGAVLIAVLILPMIAKKWNLIKD
jgi:hypothetical protein